VKGGITLYTSFFLHERVGYKLCLLVFKAVYGTAPEYLIEVCRSNAEDTARSRLRSAAHGDLRIPRSKTNFGDHACAVAVPASWNRLPVTIRSSDTLQNFKNKIESSLFSDGPFLFLFHTQAPAPLNLTPCYGA